MDSYQNPLNFKQEDESTPFVASPSRGTPKSHHHFRNQNQQTFANINITSSSRDTSEHFETKNANYFSPRRKKEQTRGNDKKKPKKIFRHLSYIFKESTDDEEDTLFRKKVNMKIGMKGFLLFVTLLFVAYASFFQYGSSDHSNSSSSEVHHEQQPINSSSSSNDNESLSCLLHDRHKTIKARTTIENVKNGAVAADDIRCSQMGTMVMEKLGGNAVDASVTTILCLGLVNPASSGIGGGAFILVHSDKDSHVQKTKSEHYVSPEFIDKRNSTFYDPRSTHGGSKVTEVIDCREVAPLQSTFDMFESLPPLASIDGPLAMAVPGELRGLELAHARHGYLPWSNLIEPVVKLAEEGVPVSAHLADDIEYNKIYINNHEELKKILTKNNDGINFLKEGDLMKRPSYAKTLRAIMDHGVDYMYKGDVAMQLAKEIQMEGGILTAQDFEMYKPVLRDPLIVDVNGFVMASIPPPSSGGAAVIGSTRFLSGYSNPFITYSDTLSKHRLVEAYKHAFSIRMSLSDPDYFSNVTESAVSDLIYGSYMEELRLMTSDTSTLPLSNYGGKKWSLLNNTDGQNIAKDAHEGDRRRLLNGHNFGSNIHPHIDQIFEKNHRRTRLFNYLEDKGTTHVSIVDKNRNAVSITSSINTYFGSRVVSASHGIIFNDSMDDFATPGRPNFYGLHPSESNYINPGKRPLSSMAPTLIFKSEIQPGSDKNTTNIGKLYMNLGASGGPKIITSVLQVFLNHAFLGLSPFDSISSPRIHDQLLYHGSAATAYDKFNSSDVDIVVSERTRDALVRRGHKIFPLDYLGTVQMVTVDPEDDTLTAASDLRKGGCSAGY